MNRHYKNNSDYLLNQRFFMIMNPIYCYLFIFKIILNPY